MATTTSTSEQVRKAYNQMKQRFRKGTISLKTGSEYITEEGAKELEDRIKVNYDAFIGSLENDHQNHTYYTDIVPRNESGYDVVVTGQSVIYDEFGTGIVGLNNPHPRKGNYNNLHTYNTGPRIHHFNDNINKDYWIYIQGGKYYVTHGIRSGHFMYDAVSEMANGEWIRKYINKISTDLYNDMKGE